jgi:hypothetical protein
MSMDDIIERAETWLDSHSSLTENYALVWDLRLALKVARAANGELWALMQRWYDVVADENYSDATRNRYRECANELDDALGAWSAKPTLRPLPTD